MAIRSFAFPHQQDDMVRVLMVLNQDYAENLKGETLLRFIRLTLERKRMQQVDGYQTEYRSYESQMSELQHKGLIARMFCKKPRPPHLEEAEDEVVMEDVFNAFEAELHPILVQILEDLQNVGVLALERPASADQVTAINRSIIVLSDLGISVSESLM